MQIVVIVAGFLLSLAVSLVLTPVVTRVAQQRRWIDTPDVARSIHVHPTPRIGGVAIVAAFLVGLVYIWLVPYLFPPEFVHSIRLPSPLIISGALVMALVGLYDDIRGIHFLWKFIFQFGVAVLLIGGGFIIGEVFNPFSGAAVALPHWIAILVTLGWVVGAINAINLLDGMDGLASGVSVIVFGSLTASYIVMGDWLSSAWVAVIVGALIGFLWYNFNPAKIFMGDSGSMFLGFLIAAYSLQGASRANSLLALLIPIIAMGLPVVDTGLTIVRRVIERRPLFRPDTDHIHHRILRRLGFSHRNTVLMLYSVSIGFGAVALLLAISGETLTDNVFTTLVLCATALGIFYLLKSLGYIKVPRWKRSASPRATDSHVAERLEEVGGTSGEPWRAGSEVTDGVVSMRHSVDK